MGVFGRLGFFGFLVVGKGGGLEWEVDGKEGEGDGWERRDKEKEMMSPHLSIIPLWTDEFLAVPEPIILSLSSFSLLSSLNRTSQALRFAFMAISLLDAAIESSPPPTANASDALVS